MTHAAAATPLISAAGLLPLTGLPRLLVVDCRFDLANPQAGREAYAAGHIPGSVFADMERDLAAPAGAGTGRHPLPTAEAFAAVLGSWGFNDDSHVVAYDQAGGAAASRLWWMLRARGHRDVQVLDGGWSAWFQAGGAVSRDAPVITATTVATRSFAGVLDAGDLQRGLAGGRVALVDARSAERFAGVAETIDPVAGHVPGALNHPYVENLGAQQRWHDVAELRRRWSATLQRAAGRRLVMMCGSGITACHNVLALDVLGEQADLYAGSWSEWITDPGRGVATGAAT